jgi:hypothetical protein
MLSKYPNQRPYADELVSRISLCDKMMEDTEDPIFADCCRVSYITERQFKSRVKALQVRINSLEQEKYLLQKEHSNALDRATRAISRTMIDEND